MSGVLTTPSSIPGIELPTGQAHLVDDAADGLRRCAHAFADNIGTITRAEQILGDWTGEAQMACRSRCSEQRDQVNHFRHGATHAATARVWEISAHSSCARRVTSCCSATFSAVIPIGM